MAEIDQRTLISGKVFTGKYNAQLNSHYHQIVSSRYGKVDRTIRAIVGLLAIASFTTSLLTFSGAPIAVRYATALSVSFLSMAAAIVLMAIPVGEFFRQYAELHRKWNAHHGRWENLENRFQLDTDFQIEGYLREINDLTAEKNHIQDQEPAPWQGLLNKCQNRVNLMYYPNSSTFTNPENSVDRVNPPADVA
jgi:hypothetical protein